MMNSLLYGIRAYNGLLFFLSQSLLLVIAILIYRRFRFGFALLFIVSGVMAISYSAFAWLYYLIFHAPPSQNLSVFLFSFYAIGVTADVIAALWCIRYLMKRNTQQSLGT